MKFKLPGIFILITIALMWSSCEEATAPELNPAIESPSNVELSISGNTVTGSWEFSSEKSIDYFLAELATDDDFQNVIERDTLQSDAREIAYEDAAVSLQYYFRIRAVTPNRATGSHFAIQQLELPNLMQPVRDADVDGSSAVVSWENPQEGTVTRIELVSETGSTRTIELTQQQIDNMSITIEDLMEGTEYTAVLYAEDLRVGLVTFTTVDTSAIITINDGDQLYKSLHRAIDNAESGDTIHIKGEHDFSDAGPVRITKSLHIRGVDDPGNPPIITFVGFDLSGEVPDFSVRGIEMIGTGDFTFDLEGGMPAANVTVEQSNITGFSAGVYNVPSGSYSFTMDSSMVHNFGIPDGERTGVFNFTGGEPVGFEVTNSTFWNVGKAFIYAGSDVRYQDFENNPPIIDHCTINDVAAGPFTYITTDNTFRLRVNNSILTNKKSDVVNGMLVLAYGNDSVAYGTFSDKFFEFFFGGTSNILNEDPQYADPANGDFTVGNQTVIDSTWGDPRWLPQ